MGVLSAILVAAITAALASAAGPVIATGGNLGAVRTDLHALETRLTAAIIRISPRRASRVNLGTIQGVQARGLEQFPAVFSRAYAQTFIPLACIASGAAS